MVEVGPATVRAAHPHGCQVADAVVAAAALSGSDDAAVLVSDDVRRVDDVWAEIWDSVVGVDSGELIVCLVVPSAWPGLRVQRIAETLRHRVARLDVRRRSAAVADAVEGDDRVAVIEIGPDGVGVTAVDGGAAEGPAVVSRLDAPDFVADAVAAEVMRARAAVALVDVAAEVPGAQPLAELIMLRLKRFGVSARPVDVGAAWRVRPIQPTLPQAVSRQRRPRFAWSAAACVAAGGALVLQMNSAHPAPTPRLPVTVVVEGALTVNVPALWPVERITTGAGSARLQVDSPQHAGAALHITQSRVPDGETLRETAEALLRAMAVQPPGVFVDFDPADERVGRPAVTYREVRAGRDIAWSVVLDGSVRISIGCEAMSGSPDDIAEACDEAVRSAHASP